MSLLLNAKVELSSGSDYRRVTDKMVSAGARWGEEPTGNERYLLLEKGLIRGIGDRYDDSYKQRMCQREFWRSSLPLVRGI